MVKNSFNSFLDQVMNIQANSSALLTALTQITSSTADQITVTQIDQNNNPVSVNIPTIMAMQNEIQILQQAIRTLSSIDQRGAIIQTDPVTSQKIIVVDLNREPNQIPNLNTISTFTSEKNWFFDNLLNPALKVSIDLTGKIDTSVRQVISRRYIINFDLDTNDQISDIGQDAINLFNQTFKGRNNIGTTELETWLVNTQGVRPYNGSTIYYDEETINLDPNALQYDGFFTILSTYEDTINMEIWYLLDTITYQEVATGINHNLIVGDEVIINNSTATTRLEIVEINNSASQIMVRFEIVEGNDPYPVGILNGLRFYSPVLTNNIVEIPIGFNEYNVIFLKAINTDNYLASRNWSNGVAFYTNDLNLSSSSGIGANGINMQTYYLNNVSDYGTMLQDVVDRFIPRTLGLIPNAPVLNTSNFKVSQTNTHLTNTPNLDTNRQLNDTVKSLRSQLNELNNTITTKRQALATKIYKSPKDQQADQQALNTLIAQSTSISQQINTTVSQILSNTAVDPTAEPEYAVVGFWDMPAPIQDGRTRPQEVIQFRIEYKYSAIDGQEPPSEIFKFNSSSGVINVVFSPWTPIITDIRSRSFDTTTQTLVWDAENLSDIDTPNINSILLPLHPNEQVDIRVLSISEAGYPESIIESDWSNTITIQFPNSLIQARNPADLIQQNAQEEDIINRITTDFNNLGLSDHLADQMTVNNKLYVHLADNVAIKDSSGNIISVTTKITQLENSENVQAEQELILTSPWANYGNGYKTATYYLNDDVVTLSGVVNTVFTDEADLNNRYQNLPVRIYGSSTINTQYAVIGTLPTGYTPSANRIFICMGQSDETSVEDSTLARIEVLTNGIIQLAQGNTGYVSLDGITFRI